MIKVVLLLNTKLIFFGFLNFKKFILKSLHTNIENIIKKPTYMLAFKFYKYSNLKLYRYILYNE